MANENDIDDDVPLGTEHSDALPGQDRASADDNVDQMLDDIIKQTGGTQDAPAKGTQDNAGTGKDGQATGQDTGSQGRDLRQRGQQQGADGQGQGAGRTAQDGTPAQTPRNIGTMFRAGADGSIYDAAGKKVANTGLERRVFDRVQRYYAGVETEHTALKQRLQMIDDADKGAQQLGLSVEERAMGLRIMSAWKKDKVGTLNFLLNQASEAGTDISAIRQGGGVDMAALSTLVAEKIKEGLAPFQPVVENIQRERELAEARDAVNVELNAFYEQFPEARQHSQFIGKIMEQYDLDHRMAYAELRVAAAQHGWDLSKPLAPQANATRAAQGRAPNGDGTPRLPAMNGRGNPGGDRTVKAGSRGLAGPETSYDDIIHGVLEDARQQQ